MAAQHVFLSEEDEGRNPHVAAPRPGDTIYCNLAKSWTPLRGNVTATKMFLSQTGDGSAAFPPIWEAISTGTPDFGDPSASIGLAAVNGVATTVMRSDAAPALDQAIAPTWTGVHTFASNKLKIAGTTSGVLSLAVPAVAGTNTITFPAGSTDFSNTGGASQVVKQVSLGAAFTVAQLAASDLSNGVTGSGAVVLASAPTITSPLLVTPNIGVATGTSLSVSGQLTSTVVTGTAPLVVSSTTLVANLHAAAADLALTVVTNANLTGPITSVGNATVVAAQTGTGSVFVMQATPTLTTPNIGAATGTSLSVSGQLTSTVSTGTAPLVVASTTLVANLHAAVADLATTVTTNANLTGPITSVGNATAVAAQTGTGSVFVMQASPTLTTPTLGVASATSLSLASALTVSNGGTGAASFTDGGVMVGNAAGALQVTAVGTAGHVLTSNGAGNDPTFQAVASGSLTTIEVTTTSATMVVETRYIANNAGLVTLTMPATAALGKQIPIRGKGAGGWKIAQVAGQTIHFGNVDTTTGTGGYLQSTNRYDIVTLECITADTDFIVVASQGSITLA